MKRAGSIRAASGAASSRPVVVPRCGICSATDVQLRYVQKRKRFECRDVLACQRRWEAKTSPGRPRKAAKRARQGKKRA